MINQKDGELLDHRIDMPVEISDINIFRNRFFSLSTAEWVELLISSSLSGRIDSVDFPAFPPSEFQNQLHGHSGAAALVEAGAFYDFVKLKCSEIFQKDQFANRYFLDFGAGWGRISRLFLRDFPLKNIVGFEPDARYCFMARRLNPYICFLSGDFLPTAVLPRARFDLVVSWSVFSHLSEDSAVQWLRELAASLSEGGRLVFTTWGERFFLRLIEEKRVLESGGSIHWYSELCIQAAENLESKLQDFRDGRFVWFTGGLSTLYGEAFVSQEWLRTTLKLEGIPLKLDCFDKRTLSQDVAVLSRI